jgi:hypothetical protein
MSEHDIFNASSTATWIECSWSALNAVPDPPKKASTQLAADAGTARHDDMEAGNVPDVEAFLAQLEPGTIDRELRVKLTDDCGGTIDIRNLNPHVTTILDGKFGKWDVAAFHNMQLLTYSAASLKDTDAEWFRLVIFQPDGLDDDPWKQWVAHRSEVIAHRDRVLRVIGERGAPRPGPWCRWCKAFQVCPAMHTDAGFVMGAMSRRIEDLTTDELVRLLRLIRALGDVKEVYEDALLTHQKMGRGDPPKAGRSFRAFNDAIQAAEFGYQNYGVKGVRSLTPAQLEKLGPAGKQYVAVAAHKPEAPLKAQY